MNHYQYVTSQRVLLCKSSSNLEKEFALKKGACTKIIPYIFLETNKVLTKKLLETNKTKEHMSIRDKELLASKG